MLHLGKPWRKSRKGKVRSEWTRRVMRFAVGAAVLVLIQGCSRSRLKPGLLEAQRESEPLRPPRDTQRIVFETIDKVDLLFVIDNSPSMADKQELLGEAVPTLLERLINPPCISVVDRNDAVAVDGPEAGCPMGYEKEFEPLIDLHVGVVTSSLGTHGGDLCGPDGPGEFNPTQDDHGHLLASVREGLSAYSSAGFLAWDPAGNKNPPGDRAVGTFIGSFQDHVVAAGEVGCGYEATQEAWYRFLVEPDPYQTVVTDGNFAFQQGTDRALLAQRAAFVRPDSLMMIVVLSDEDDCSVVDGGIGYLTSKALLSGAAFIFPAATSACNQEPNHVCCRSCGLQEDSPPPGCLALADDPGCRAPRSSQDSLNLRCHRQKQRFGLDLLYPVARYSDALKQPTVFDTRHCDPEAENAAFLAGCPLVQNPLFAGRRDPSMIIYTAIVGVPWQDIATSESLTGPGLEYLRSDELEALERWEVMLGNPEAGVPPLDPLMIAQTEPRSGMHPITGEAVAPIDSIDPQANSINGHEMPNIDNSELQYACIFPLQTPRLCSDSELCDCSESSLPKNRPICKPPGGGPAGTMQYFAKAYPGLRHLQVAKELGEAASVASVCPKTTTPPTTAPSYGYNPAAQHMYERLAGGLGERCLSTPLPHASDGRAECVLWQFREGDCDCRAAGLQEVDARAVESVERMLAFECTFQRRFDCEHACACQLPQFAGTQLEACQQSATASGIDGWCSIDPSQNIGDPQFVTDCRVGHPRTLRLLGRVEPLKDQELYLTCPE